MKKQVFIMKRQFFIPLILLCSVHLAFAQGGRSSVVRLNTGSEVTNTIFWHNFGYMPASFGVDISHSALDTSTGEATNILLLSTPFSSQDFRINSASPAYNTGTNSVLGVTDVRDLDYNPRISCDQVDMGAFEFPVVPARILVQPHSVPVCEGTPFELSVVAEGTTVSYQWQKNGVNLVGQTGSVLRFWGDPSEAGEYRVIVLGDCCSDTSVTVQVVIESSPISKLIVRSDTTVNPGGSVELRVYSAVGNVTWYASDLTTVIPAPYIISNITVPQRYIAVARSGACAEEAYAEVFIFVEGIDPYDPENCLIRTGPDVFLCHGESYFLHLDSASMDYTWWNVNTGTQLDKFTWQTPDVTTRFAAVANSGHCSDTVTVTIHTVNLVVMGGLEYKRICGGFGGEYVDLISSPPATWFYKDDGREAANSDLFGIARLYVLNDRATRLEARFNDGTCEAVRDFTIYAHPNRLQAFPEGIVICLGDSVQLSTDFEPRFVNWYRGDRIELLPFDYTSAPGPVVRPTTTTVYQAWVDGGVCGLVHAEITVTVQTKPEFRITSPDEACENNFFMLFSIPNATRWTKLDGERVFNPVFKTALNYTYIGWYNDGVCEVSDTIHITTFPPPHLETMADTTIVRGSVVELWANSPYVYWTQLFGSFLGQGTVLVSPTDSVTYFLADKRHACDVRDTVRIFVVDHIHIPDPEHPITDDNVRFYSDMGCENGTGWITVVICDSVNTGPFTFTWLVNNVVQPSWNDSTRTGLNTGISYTVIVRDAADSVIARTITFTLPPPMQIVPRIVNPTVSTCDNGQVSITVTGGVSPYTFHWDDAPGFNSPDRVNVGATLFLTVEDSRGCSTAQIGIQLQCSYYRRVMPTLYISPNDDGHNDYLTINYIEYYPRNRVVIFNSYGVRVRTIENYCNDTPERRWDGRNDRGRLLPDGVYYYVVEADGVEHPMAGWILMRASRQ